MNKVGSIALVLVILIGAVAVVYATGIYSTDTLFDDGYSSPSSESGIEVPAPGLIDEDDVTGSIGDGVQGGPTESGEFASSGLDISIEDALSMCQSRAQECSESLSDTEASAYLSDCDDIYRVFTSGTTSMSEEEIAIFEEEGSFALITYFDDAC